jgi:UDP-glucose 4-epimerase
VRAVVTGGAGFVGSHVVEALVARGDDVTVVDNLSSGRRENVPDGVPLIVSDIREPLDEELAEARPDVVFHLAAQIDVRRSVADPLYDADVNVLGTLRVLEAARAHDAQVVFSSTGGAIYGECETGPALETAARLPLSPYGTSKLAAEEYLAAYNRLNGSSHVSLRYGNVYGPRQDPHGEAGVVAIFFNCFRSGTTPKIYGDGRQTRDYVFAGEVAQVTVAAAGRGGVYNVGTGRETSVLELYELCRQAAGADVEAEQALARPGELQRSVLDTSLAERDLGWRAERDLADGLRETWAWISST